MPLSYRMKTAQPELVVDLDQHFTQVLGHWGAVDRVLPAAHPLVLLQDVTREASATLVAGLSALRRAVEERETHLALARGDYEMLKADLHRRLPQFNSLLRGYYQGSRWFAARRRVPGRGQSFEHWSETARAVLTVWRAIADAPPTPGVSPLAHPGTLGDGTTVEQFAELLRAFEAAYWRIMEEEVELKIASGNLMLAQDQATALLMAYGHGVRARLGNRGTLVEMIPRLWPEHTRANAFQPVSA
jgi:hypothetical protein